MGSWQNHFTAELAMEVAATISAEAAGSFSIAIISPYRAQVRLLRRWIREERRADTTPLRMVVLEAGTVHQFQGSDADVVIFDLVDGEGRPGLGRLLRDDTGMRLVNVAITRAKGKLIVIADKRWCEGANTEFNNGLLRTSFSARTLPMRFGLCPWNKPLRRTRGPNPRLKKHSSRPSKRFLNWRR